MKQRKENDVEWRKFVERNHKIYEDMVKSSDKLQRDIAPEDWRAKSIPEDISHGIMYQLFLRAFTPEGTLSAAKAKLSFLAELGIDIIYLSPIQLQDDDMRKEYWSDRQVLSGLNNPKNPYRIKDYDKIDPEYGDKEDLHAFIKEAHSLNMKILLDIVYFHCGPSAPIIKEHPDFIKRNDDGSLAPGMMYHFPIFDYSNPAVNEYFWGNLEYWVKTFEIDGYRCDVADWIPLSFWEEGRTRLERLNPEIIMLAEGDRREYDQLQAFDFNYCSRFNNTLRKTFNEKTSAEQFNLIKKQEDEQYPKGTRFIRYIENHDIAHNAINDRFERKWGHEAMEVALALCFSYDGMPLVYNGEEIADDAPHCIYGNFPINWDNQDTSTGNNRYKYLQELCALRHNESALSLGTIEFLENNQMNSIVSIIRAYKNERIIAVVNTTEDAVDVAINFGVVENKKYSKLLSRRSTMLQIDGDGKGILSLEGYGIFIGKGVGKVLKI